MQLCHLLFIKIYQVLTKIQLMTKGIEAEVGKRTGFDRGGRLLNDGERRSGAGTGHEGLRLQRHDFGGGRKVGFLHTLFDDGFTTGHHIDALGRRGNSLPLQIEEMTILYEFFFII